MKYSVADLSLWVAIAVLVLVSQGKLQRIVLLDLLIHHLLTLPLKIKNQTALTPSLTPTSSAVQHATYCINLI